MEPIGESVLIEVSKAEATALEPIKAATATHHFNVFKVHILPLLVKELIKLL